MTPRHTTKALDLSEGSCTGGSLEVFPCEPLCACVQAGACCTLFTTLHGWCFCLQDVILNTTQKSESLLRNLRDHQAKVETLSEDLQVRATLQNAREQFIQQLLQRNHSHRQEWSIQNNPEHNHLATQCNTEKKMVDEKKCETIARDHAHVHTGECLFD